MKFRDAMTLVIAVTLALGAERIFLGGHAAQAGWWFQIPGILAVFGFAVCLGLAFGAKILGKYWLQRHERYYQQGSARHE